MRLNLVFIIALVLSSNKVDGQNIETYHFPEKDFTLELYEAGRSIARHTRKTSLNNEVL